MVQILTAFVVIVSMLFGGAGATVYAAQDSLPTEALYPVKTVSEDMLLVLVTDPQARLDLVLDFTNRRVEEIVAIVAGGDAIPEDVINRLQSELDMTLEIAAGLEDPELSEALTKIHIYIRDQDRIMGMTHVPEDSEAAFARLRANIRAQNQVVAEALETPLKFSNKFQNQLQNNRPVVTDTLPITTTETISDTQGIMMEGPGPAAGPGPGEPLGPQAGPGSDQGHGPQAGPGSEGETGSQAGPGPSEGADSQAGPGPYGPVVTQEPAKPSTEPSKEGSGNGGK